MELPLVGGTYQDRTVNFNAERRINLYAVQSESPTAQNKFKLIGTPGTEQFLELSPGFGTGIRAQHTTSDDRFFIVAGNTLFEVDSFGLTATNIGTLSSISGTVKIADNGTQLCIVDGVAGYIYNLTYNTFQTITDPNFPNGAVEVVYKDTYFITTAPNTGVIYISNNNDGTVWSDDLASVESNPDIVLGIVSLESEVLFFGSKSIERWYNSGNADFPFERISGGVLDVGTKSRQSIAKIGDSVFFLGANKDGYNIVYSLTNGQLDPISTNAINYQISRSDYLTGAIAYSYQEEGHYFYVLGIPEINKTFVYNANTKLWHEWAFTDGGGEFIRHKSSCQAFWKGNNYIGDYTSNKIFRLSLDLYDDDGDVINRRCDLTVLSSENKQISFSKLELKLQPGIGTETDVDGNESQPNVGLVISKDGGYTWGNELVRTAGMIGRYETRVIWRNMGVGRNWVFSLRTSARNQICWIGLFGEMSQRYA